MKTFECSKCKKEIDITEGSFTSGYGLDKDNNKICYSCCALDDIEYMKNNKKTYLYLNTTDKTLSNWPGSLKIKLNHIRIGRHNIAGKRYDTWFKFAGKNWHGVTYGDNTQICHCSVVK